MTLPDGITVLRRSHRAADQAYPHLHEGRSGPRDAAIGTRRPAWSLVILAEAREQAPRQPQAGAVRRRSSLREAPRLRRSQPSPRPRSAVMYLCLLVTVEEIPQYDSTGHASLPDSIVSPSSNTTELRGSAPGFVGSKPPSQYKRERTQHTARSADRDLAAAGRALRRAGDALDPGRSPRCCVGAGTDAPTRPATRTGDRPRRSERA